MSKRDDFEAWWWSAPHRQKYSNDHPAYLAAQEAWQARAALAQQQENIGWEYYPMEGIGMVRRRIEAPQAEQPSSDREVGVFRNTLRLSLDRPNAAPVMDEATRLSLQTGINVLRETCAKFCTPEDPYGGLSFGEDADNLQAWLDAQQNPEQPRCSCCGTTEGLVRDVGSGGPWCCRSPNCMVF